MVELKELVGLLRDCRQFMKPPQEGSFRFAEEYRDAWGDYAMVLKRVNDVLEAANALPPATDGGAK